MDIYNEIKKTDQSVYDNYNNFIFSDDARVFNKMGKRIELYLKIQNLVGDIFEFGVLKGAGISLWLKLITMYEPNSITKVLGFDFFDTTELLDDLTGINKQMMSEVVNRIGNEDLQIETIQTKLSHFDKSKYILIKGDAVVTSKSFVEQNVGVKIKLLYMDLDLGDPTYEILMKLWDNVCLNGIIVFDEYAYHKWDESNGVDKFLKEIEGQYTFFDTKIGSPTAYIIKLVI